MTELHEANARRGRLKSNAILTGSRVYGIPGEHSDLDLVVFMDPAEAAELAEFMGSEVTREGDNRYPGTQFKCGLLNVIVVTNHEAFEVWVTGTDDLVKRKPVTRDQAVEQFKMLREVLGLKATLTE